MSSPAPIPSRFSVVRRAAAWTIYAAMRLVVLLPFRWQLALGKRLGRLARRIAPGRARIARRNLEVCFPELSPAERERLLEKHFEALGAGFVETAMGWFGSKQTIRNLVHVQGEEHLRRAQENGKGVILFSAHFTTFEFFFPKLELLCTRLCGMYKWQRNPIMNDVMQRGRQRNFDELIPKDSVRGMLRNLARNSVVWYASDQSYGRKHSALIPFFGEPAMTNTAISRIARTSGAVVLPYFCRRLPDDSGYMMSIEPPLPDFPSEDRIEDTRRLTERLEAYVRICPEQYLWIHQRFKGRPEPLANIYRAASHPT